MSQTSVIFFYLLAAFVVFVTARGELPKYIEILTGGGKAAPLPQQQASNSGIAGSGITMQDVQTAVQVAAIAGG